jgi:hypothetical protein
MPIVVPFVKAEARSPLRHVFMVGAGFSKAIHDAMPTLDQVGQVVARRIVNRPALGELPDAVQATLRNGFIPGGDLEAWLSTLATPPPFVSEIETHFYAGIFAQVAFDIGEEVEASESKVLAQDPPSWLVRLVRIWNVIGATVITFNYDTLVEHAAVRPILPWGDRWPNVAFSLLKVHGSTNWWRARGSASGGDIAVQKLLPGWGVEKVRLDPVGDQRVLIPPIVAKGSFYDLSFIRRQWQQARAALESATTLCVVGYRLPDNDLAATALVGQHLATNAQIVVVNRSPEQPTSVLERNGRNVARVVGGDDCISEFVAEYDAMLASEIGPILVQRLEPLEWDLPLMAVLGDDQTMRTIADITDDGDRLVLIASDNPKYGEELEKAARVNTLRGRLKQMVADNRRLVIRLGGRDYVALGMSEANYGARWMTVEA